MVPPKPQPSTPFASREFNGEVLLEELEDLRTVPVRQLTDFANALDELMGVRATEATQRLLQLAAGRFASPPQLSTLIKVTAKKLKVDADVPLLIAHFERLAITAAITQSIRRAVPVSR
jgi:hypothetical protein